MLTVSLFLFIAAAPVLRPAEADGVHVDYLAPEPGHTREVNWPGEARYAENVERAKKALADVSSRRLVALLDRVKDGTEWWEMPCYECIAAIELLGERGDPIHAAVMEAVSAAYLGRGFFPAKPDARVYPRALTDAWMALKVPHLSGDAALAWARREFAKPYDRSRQLRLAAAYALYDRELERRGWVPEIMAFFDDPSALVRRAVLWTVDRGADLPEHVRDQYVRAVLDADEEIRNSMQSPNVLGGDPAWIPAILRFLNGPGVTPAARKAAEGWLRVRGYVAKKVDGRWVAVPMAEEAAGAPATDGGETR